MSRRSCSILLAAFVLSIMVRLPLVDRPLSAHHEYCTAFTLIALTNWWEDGFSTHHGVPSGGFVREGERFLAPEHDQRNERATALYYFSHPPLAYDAPFVLFKVAGMAPNVAGLQWMNMFFHLITTIAVFLVVHLAAKHERVALYTALLYLFLPVTLWFHGNAYMSDMFVQVPWVWNVFFALRVLQGSTQQRGMHLLGFGLTLFLTLYTSWLGVFAAIATVFVALLLWRRDRTIPVVRIVIITGVAFIAAFGLTAWRYLHVIDASALIDHLGARFTARNSFSGVDAIPLFKQILVNYRISFLPVVVLMLILALRSYWKGTLRQACGDRSWRTFLLLAGLPVLLEHIVLLQYVTHDFAALKAAPLLCGVAGLSLSQLPVRWGRLALFCTCLCCVLYFYRTNPLPGSDGDRYQQEMDLGHFIAANSAADELVFGVGVSTEPQVVWYARRNVLGVADEQVAHSVLSERGLQKGVVITSTNGLFEARHITR